MPRPPQAMRGFFLTLDTEAVMKLGTFQTDQYGTLNGKLCALGVGVIPVAFEPETSKDGKPYFRVMADPYGEGYEIGAAFEKQKDGMTYYSVSLESPAFKAPINAALFPDRSREGIFNLVWDRPEQQKPQMQAKAEAGQTQARRQMGATMP